MCVVSMVGDHYQDKWKTWPDLTYPNKTVPFVTISKEEFDALKREVEDMKALLIRAKEYDEKNGEPSCEIEDKVALLKKVAAAVGVTLEDVFGQQQEPALEWPTDYQLPG